MPVMNMEEKVEKIFLPSTQKKDKDGNPTVPEEQWGFVVMETSPLCAADTTGVKEETKEGEIGIMALAGRIRDWNYVDQAGSPIPINEKTVGKLHAADYGHLMSLISGGDDLDPKASEPSSDTSSHRVTVNQQ